MVVDSCYVPRAVLDDAKQRDRPDDQPDIDRIIVPPANEFLGSVERIDKEAMSRLEKFVDASFERSDDLSQADINLKIAFMNKHEYYSFERKLEGDTEKQLRDALTEFAKQFSTDEKKA